MKRLIMGGIVFCMTILLAVPAVAAVPAPGSWQTDAAAAFGTGPENFDDGFGLTLGAGYMMPNIDNLQARVDVSYFLFDRSVLGQDIDYTRIPVTVSGRYYFPLASSVNLFAEAGIETSFDEVEFVDFGGVRHSDSEVNVGFTPGGGAELFLGDKISLFALARFHVITDDYFSAHLGAAYHY